MRKAHMSSRSTRGKPIAARSEQADSAEVESIRSSLVALRRLFQRRELAELWAHAFGDRAALDYADLRLLDAVRVAQSSTSPEGASVGDVSRLLGVDPSRASRQVGGAVRKGLLKRHAAQADARKVVLVITAAGARLLAKGSEVSRSRIALALDAWTVADRRRLAGLLDRFVDQLLLEHPARTGRDDARR
jgi:DNA-binding MarR family transcriptional regulator